MYDTIIVGTGIGGLTAGLSLVRKGHSVLLLEAAKQFGGMLNPFSRKKYHFDVGIHYLGELGEGQSMRRLFDSLGLEDLKFREINPDCIDRYIFADYEARLVKGIDRWGDILVKDFPREEANIRKFLELMKQCRELGRIALSGMHIGDVPGILRHGGDLLRLTRLPLSAVTERYFEDPILRNVFAGPGGDIGLPPSRASAFFSISLLLHYLAGGYYPVGGSGAIRDAYVDALRAEGAEMMCNQPVTTIRVLGEKRFEVRTAARERFEARSVISNVDAKFTMDMIEGAQPNYVTRRKVDRLKPSLGSFCVFLATDLDVSKAGITDANIWHYGSDDLEAGYDSIFKGRVPDQPFFFLTSPTLKDPDSRRAPRGHHTVELITFAPTEMFKPWFDKPSMKRGQAYDALKNEIAERVIAGAEQYIPGLRDHIILKETATPATVWHFVRGRDGGIYGPEHTPEQSLLRRVFTKVGIPGLYLCGASVLGGGIMPCMMSGTMAARAARSHLEREVFGQLDDLSRAMSWVGRKAMLRTTPQKLHSNVHQLRRNKRYSG